MDPNVMLDDLKGQQENLRKELLETERLFNQKKEQFILLIPGMDIFTIVQMKMLKILKLKNVKIYLIKNGKLIFLQKMRF